MAEISAMRKLLFLFLVLIFSGSAYAQGNKAWVSLAVKDAEKVLNDSPWAKTQTETDTSEMFFSPTKAGTASTAQVSTGRGPVGDQQIINNNRADRGATNQ